MPLKSQFTKSFQAYGERACRWFENPEAVGLRFVGLAHDVAPTGYAYSRPAVEHTGWYLDEDGGETVAGVVYQLPGRNGRARYLAGYADPYNTDSDGRGPALLSLDVITGERRDSDWEADSAIREAARRADGIAERMAEQERDYQSGWTSGSAARELSREALIACQMWTQAVRATRAVFRNRHKLDPRDRRLLFKAQAEQARYLCEEFKDARREAWEARADVPGAFEPSRLDGFRNGYSEA